MLKITFILTNLQTGKQRRCTRHIRREEFINWIDLENSVSVVCNKLVMLTDLAKHTMIQHV